MKETKGEKAFNIVNNGILLIIGLIMIYGFWNQICVSFSEPTKAMAGGFFLIPKGFSTVAYESVLTSSHIWRGYSNTIFITIVGTLLSVTVTALMAYPLSKDYVPGTKVINFLLVFTMLFSGGMIPTYLTVRAVGLLNTRWALIVPMLLNAYNVIIMKNFFMNISPSLEESAKIDGASEYTVFVKIILPLSKPVLATITLWVSVAYWNDFFNAMMFLRERALYPLQLVLKEIINASSPDKFMEIDEDSLFATPETIKAASAMVAAIPILAVYPFIQKYFAKGVMLGSVKG